MEQFIEISTILLVTLLVSVVMRFLKQPLVIGYIIAGLIVGPYFLNILHSVETVELFSKLGITALLFIVGLGLSPKVLKELGVVATVIGLGQIIFTSVIGYGLSMLLGFSVIESLYIAVALTFSSTIIILKLLSDKGDVNKLYGRITIGVLLVQDLVATVILVAIAGLESVGAGSSIATDMLLLLAKGFVLLLILFAISSVILPRLTSFVAQSQEFLFIASLTWGMVIASLYHVLGLSVEIGALVAGVTLSLTPYAFEISSRLKPLRDFFITLFFILLGFQMILDSWQSLLFPAAVLSLFILLGSPIIVLVLMNLLGYTRKTAFVAGITLAQISEFSLILIALGYKIGHIDQEIVSMVTLVGIFTIATSTYYILYSDTIYKKLGKHMNMFELRKKHRVNQSVEKHYDAILFGYKRAGPEFAHVFRESKTNFLVVDFNPDVIKQLEKIGIRAEYGDASDVEFLQELPLSNIKMAVSTVPDYETSYLLTQMIRKVNDKAVILLITDTMDHALNLYEAGATNVILSHYIGAQYAAEMIQENGLVNEKYNRFKEKHVKYLSSIKELTFHKH